MLLPLELQKEAAQKALDDFTRKAKADFGAVAGSSNKVNDSLEQIAASTKRIDFGAAMDRGIGKFGDLKDIIEKTGESVGGLNEETVKAAASSLDMSQKFASFGALLGPVGVGIGAVVGGLVGYASASREAAKATQELQKAEEERAEKTRLTLLSTSRALHALAAVASGDEFKLANKSFADLEQGVRNAGLAIEDTGREAEEAAKKYDLLRDSGNATTEQLEEARVDLEFYKAELADSVREQNAYSAAVAQANKDMEETSATTEVTTKKVKTHTAAVKEQTDAYEWLSKALAAKDESKPKRELDTQSREDQEEAEALAAFDKQEATNAKLEQASRDHYQRVADNRRKIQEEDAKEEERLQQERVDRYASQLGRVTSITSELTAQLEANVAAGENLFNDFGIAAERGVSQVLKSLSKEWTVKAIGETAEGLAALASQRYKSAGEHFASAAGFGAAAVAAGVGGAVVGGDASRRANDEDTRGGGGSSSPSDSRISDPGTQNLTPIVVNFNSTVPATERDAQEAAAKIEGILAKGKRR